MKCDHPECTGVHALRRWSELCPAARERKREWQREWVRTKRATDPEWVERQREWTREWYENLTGYQYNRRLLQRRRNKALHRMAKRNARLEQEVSNG